MEELFFCKCCVRKTATEHAAPAETRWLARGCINWPKHITVSFVLTQKCWGTLSLLTIQQAKCVSLPRDCRHVVSNCIFSLNSECLKLLQSCKNTSPLSLSSLCGTTWRGACQPRRLSAKDLIRNNPNATLAAMRSTLSCDFCARF